MTQPASPSSAPEPALAPAPARRRHTALTALPALAALLLGGTLTAPAAHASPAPREGHCAGIGHLHVPGAARQQADCLDELTTAGTVRSGHSDPADWAGLTPAALTTPSGVPGIQIDGYFPDTSTTNTHHGWNHDAQFVLRLPDHWNGGLVVTGSPGVRAQYANDRAIGDFVLARGYAFAATDKGNTGGTFYRDGDTPGGAIAEWNDRVTQLTRAARSVVAQRYHRAPRRTLAAGVSNGGYLVRWQLENHPELYDGGVDWEGTLWRKNGAGPNLFTYLPAALRAYPRYADGGPDADAAHREMVAAGFPAGSEFLWPYHYRYYWDVTQRIYREEIDPGYDGATEAGTPYCTSGTPRCDADYDYAARPRSVHDAVSSIGLTGRIGKPMITLQGTLDVLLPISTDSDVYARMVHAAGRSGMYRYYRVEDGTHVDGLFDAFPKRLRPLTPCFQSSFTALVGWLDHRGTPPRSHTVPRPAHAAPAELANDCPLEGAAH
jgi:tannase/feruloyl esterase/3HB-oligomer hydrolase 3HBOH